MQDLEALEAKSLSELKQIAKALGIDARLRRSELIRQISGGAAVAEPTPATEPVVETAEVAMPTEPTSAEETLTILRNIKDK